ncbi:MAG: nickel transporter permease [Thermomicrobiales bacterium]
MAATTTPTPTPTPTSPRLVLDARRDVRSRKQIFMARLLANRLAVLGGIIVILLVLIAIFGPLFAPHDPLEMAMANQFKPPSRTHWMGTDDFGRDVLSRLIYGSRQSLMVGVVSIAIGATVGMTIGLISGYVGGRTDMVVQRLIDVMLAFPDLLLALAIVAILGPSLINVMIAVGIGSIPVYSRLIRGQVLALKEKEYVESAQASGALPLRIIVAHILPNSLSPLIIMASLGIAGAILTGAALSFIGMGAQPPAPEWGAMLSSGRSYLRHEWWIATFPGLALAVTAFGFNLLGDGLRDALDPRTQD